MTKDVRCEIYLLYKRADYIAKSEETKQSTLLSLRAISEAISSLEVFEIATLSFWEARRQPRAS